jgi:hypothetical protein
LREAEAEREKLREQIDGMQRIEVERLAQRAGLSAPEDIWNFGASLDTLRADDGTIDRATVEGTVQAILKDRPGLQGRPVGDLGAGRGAAAAGTRHEPKIGLSDLLKPRTR